MNSSHVHCSMVLLVVSAACFAAGVGRRQAVGCRAHAQVGWCAEAEEDCNRALQLEAPVLNPKTLLRRATARVAMQNIRAARADYKQVTVSRLPVISGPLDAERCATAQRYLEPLELRTDTALKRGWPSMQVLALQPNNRQALEELHALRDVPDELEQTPVAQDDWQM